MSRSGLRKVFEAALEDDVQLSGAQKDRIRQVLNGEDCDADGVEPMLLTQRQTCKALGVSRFTIFRMVRDGQLHPVMIRGAKRYRREELAKISRTGVAA